MPEDLRQCVCLQINSNDYLFFHVLIMDLQPNIAMSAFPLLLDKALPGLVVAVVTQTALIIRGYIDKRTQRSFLRADLCAEAEECLRVLDLFMKAIGEDVPESSTDMGVGIAIYMAPIQCQCDYDRLVRAIRSALPALDSNEFEAASKLKQCFRLIVGYSEGCNRYFKQLQEASLSPGVTETSLEARREIFRRFGKRMKAEIDSNANSAQEAGLTLINSLEKG